MNTDRSTSTGRRAFLSETAVAGGCIAVGGLLSGVAVASDAEHELFGDKGFQRMADRVAAIEKTLGIYELGQFTPR